MLVFVHRTLSLESKMSCCWRFRWKLWTPKRTRWHLRPPTCACFPFRAAKWTSGAAFGTARLPPLPDWCSLLLRSGCHAREPCRRLPPGRRVERSDPAALAPQTRDLRESVDARRKKRRRTALLTVASNLTVSFTRGALRRITNQATTSGDQVRWIQCETGCGRWYHLVCVGLTVKRAKEIPSYTCYRCEATNNSEPAAIACK